MELKSSLSEYWKNTPLLLTTIYCHDKTGSSAYIHWRSWWTVNTPSSSSCCWYGEPWKWSHCCWHDCQWLDCFLWVGHYSHRAFCHWKRFQVEGCSTECNRWWDEEIFNRQPCLRLSRWWSIFIVFKYLDYNSCFCWIGSIPSLILLSSNSQMYLYHITHQVHGKYSH